MLFGLVMSQDVFQQKMDMILEQCPGTIGLIDDVVVYEQTKAEHVQNLHNLMKVGWSLGLFVNSTKFFRETRRKYTSLELCLVKMGSTQVPINWMR